MLSMTQTLGAVVRRGGNPAAPPLGLLHDFDPTRNLTLTSGVVSAWQSRMSGAAITQGTAGSRPSVAASAVFARRQVVTFDGVDDALNGAFTLNVPCMIILAATWNATTLAKDILDGFSANRARVELTAATTVQFGTAFFFSGTVATPASPHVYTLDIETAAATARLDGAQIATAAGTPQALGGLTLGAIGGAAGNFASCSIARVLVYDPTVGGFDMTKPEKFLKALYGTP